MTSKHHCMVVHAYYPLGETRVEREALTLVDRGYQVDLICLKGKNEPEVSDEQGVTVYRLRARRRLGRGVLAQLWEYLVFFFKAFLKLTALHLKRRYNVVQLHNLPDFLVFAALIPKFTGAKIILDIHDVMPEFYAARFETTMDSLPVRLVRWQEYLSCRFADHVVTVTELWRQSLIERGVKAEKCSVVMNVADARVFHKIPAEQMPPRDNNRFGLIYHGILSPRYGLDLIIRAVSLVRHKAPDIHFTIHGGGELWQDELNALMALADELGVSEHMYFSTEFVDIAEVPAIIRKADVGVVAYRRDVFTDGILPTKIMEYVALGMPVIAARTPAIDAYFDDSMIAFFTPENVQELADTIYDLYTHRERLPAMVAGAEAFNRQYSWAKVSADYVALVDRLGTG